MSCAAKVRETLSKVTDVDKVVVDFKAKTATVTMKDGVELKKDTIEAALKGSQYSVTSFTKAETPKQEEKAKAYVATISGIT